MKGKQTISNILKVLAYIFAGIAILIITMAIIGNIIAIPKGLPIYKYLWQINLKLIEPFNPFNILNFVVTILLLLPTIILFWLSERFENKKNE